MLVSACMTPDPLTIKTDSTIYDAMQMMLERDIRHLPVVDERGELVGMLSDRDLRKFSLSFSEDDAHMKDRLKAPALDLANTDTLTVSSEDELKEAIEAMLENKVGALPVVDPVEDKLVGILSYIDVLRAAAEVM